MLNIQFIHMLPTHFKIETFTIHFLKITSHPAGIELNIFEGTTVGLIW